MERNNKSEASLEQPAVDDATFGSWFCPTWLSRFNITRFIIVRSLYPSILFFFFFVCSSLSLSLSLSLSSHCIHP